MTTPVARPRTTAYEPWRRTLLTSEEVRRLSQLEPPRVVIDAARSWALIIGAWAAVAYHTTWWVVLLAIPLIGSAYYALFIIGHDGLHRRLFHGRARNDLFNDLVVLGAIGAITRINNLNHLEHHDHLATADDPDRHKYGCFNKWESGRLIAYLSGVATLITSARHVYVTNSRRNRGEPGPETVRGPRGYSARDLLILAGWQVALIAGLSWAIGWWAWPVLWLAPVFGFTFLMDNLRTFCEHSQPEADSKADSHRLISYLSTPIERWFISPMNMNIHAIHHLWPSIPYYRLPEAARLVRSRPDGGGPLEWRRSYLGYLWRYWRALPLEECRVSSVQAA
jgi:fatty acid desaturase